MRNVRETLGEGVSQSTRQMALAGLEALQRAELLDTEPEARFDRITALVRDILDVPVALVSLVDDARQFFKSASGLPEPWATKRETPLSHSFCKHVVADDAPLVVTNAETDQRVIDSRAIADLGVTAYLGVPIHAEGHAIGALCAIDTKPRLWEQHDLNRLLDLAALTDEQITLRAIIRERDKALSEAELLAHEHSHRMKNSLSVAASLVTISASEADTVEEVTRVARDRITALSKAQNLGWLREGAGDLHGLLDALLGAFRLKDEDDSMIRLAGDKVRLPMEKVTPLSLILHELATNASKYGALAAPGGSITVDWALEDDKLALSWTERHANGSGTPHSGNGQAGFGTRLLDLCVRQLSGTSSVSHAGGARRVSIDLPWGP